MLQFLRRRAQAARLLDAHNLGLLLFQILTRFGQKLSRARYAVARLNGDKNTVPVSLIERHLLAVYARHMPAPRMQETNSQVRIFVEEKCILGIRLRLHST